MFRRLTYALLEQRINRAYGDRLAQRGTTAAGVFWRSEASQSARFKALLSLVQKAAPNRPVSLADIGCGYGALRDYIGKDQAYRSISYLGVDINRAMIAACHKKFAHETHLFTCASLPPGPVDFCLFSGTFNLTHCDDPALWEDYIFAKLADCLRFCQSGLVLNLICAPKTEIWKQIFYANRANFVHRAEQQLGRTIAQSTPGVSGDFSFLITAAKD